MLGLEDVLEAELVGELDLLERLLEDLVLLVLVPLLAIQRPQARAMSVRSPCLNGSTRRLLLSS